MIKPKRLRAGDKVAIVSLSTGVLGEAFAAHELVLGEKRLAEFSLMFEYMPNARKGIEFIKNNPRARADDLKQAFADPTISGIICAIGGDDTYTTIPYLLDDPEFVQIVRNNPKIFLGFSDTTNNHFMFYKLGLQTYYGQAFLTDLAEFADEMLPYSKEWFSELLEPSQYKEIASSAVWYNERESYGTDQIGVNRTTHDEKRGFEILHGNGIVQGHLLGGCIDSMYEMLCGNRYDDQKAIIEKYQLFPSGKEWQGKVLFVETSEEKPSPDKLHLMIQTLANQGVFANAAAILVGKPQDEAFYDEYKVIWEEISKTYDLPIIYNLNFGHSAPRCILPYGANIKLDLATPAVSIAEPMVN